MFSGIISGLGLVLAATKKDDLRVRIACPFPLEEIRLGESIACNGACLTVVAFDRDAGGDSWFEADLSAETVACTAPHQWKTGERVNLERALKLGDALDGHLVTGHVDGLAEIIAITPSDGSHILEIKAPSALAKFIAAKGSVTLDGVSLTVNRLEKNNFFVNIIPHTWDVTTLGRRKVGDVLNLEVDLVARYLARLNEAATESA